IKKGLYHDKQVKFSIRRLGKTFLHAIPALCIPVIILGGIMSGVVSPTESAALAVFAGLLIGGLVYRELTWRNIWASVVESVKSSATVMIIVATATILGYAFTVLGVSRQIMQPLLLIADTQVKLMLITSLILFIGGFFLDGTVMVLVLVPLFMPAMQAMAIDPLQFAMLVIVVWCIGQQTPPVASGLYVTCALAKVGMIEASKYNLTYLAVFVVFALGLIFIPDVVLYLPRLFIGQG
ncbi:MAG: TRAP transporter large permease subunit, partial [Firmicutes bacterium]|nr:TRAP transporter large permease subunit [Bacillota bacterium]